MRIITGKLRGRIIKMPKGIRPTQAKVRKAVFDILGDIEGLSFLELFAGSGAVGFEAISRGISELTLVEDNQNALKTIRNNIESLKLTSCNLCPFDAKRAIQAFYKEKRGFDIIFLDPPYYKGIGKKTLQMLGGYDILAPNGLLVVQHFKKDNLPDQSGRVQLVKSYTYADTVLSVYIKNE